MTTQHTPGPWRLSSGDETEIFSGAKPVARAHCGGLTSVKLPEAEANARLIAAAPEMLAALQALTITARTFRNVPKEEQEWTPYDDAALDNAYAIIARAQGAAQ